MGNAAAGLAGRTNGGRIADAAEQRVRFPASGEVVGLGDSPSLLTGGTALSLVPPYGLRVHPTVCESNAMNQPLPPSNTFRCYLVTKDAAGRVAGQIAQRNLDELPPGEVLIRVAYSSLNYKDALAATGHPGVNKVFPHVPGVDASGVVAKAGSTSSSPAIRCW